MVGVVGCESRRVGDDGEAVERGDCDGLGGLAVVMA